MFSFTKVCIFLPMVCIMFFIKTVCFNDFCKTVLVKKYTPLPRYDLIFPNKCHKFTLALCGSLTTQLKPHYASENMKKRLDSNSRRGLRAPDPANPSSEKMTSQATFFCCTYFPKSGIKLYRLFDTSNINTHFDMFLQN